MESIPARKDLVDLPLQTRFYNHTVSLPTKDNTYNLLIDFFGVCLLLGNVKSTYMYSEFVVLFLKYLFCA